MHYRPVIVACFAVTLLSACTQQISSNPIASSLPAGGIVATDLQNAMFNLDQAVAIKALPATDPADACLHGVLGPIGLDPSSPLSPAQTFTPKISGVVSAASDAYIRAEQAKSLGLGGAVKLPDSCKAIIGQFVIDGLAAAKNIVPGAGLLPTIQ